MTKRKENEKNKKDYDNENNKKQNNEQENSVKPHTDGTTHVVFKASEKEKEKEKERAAESVSGKVPKAQAKAYETQAGQKEAIGPHALVTYIAITKQRKQKEYKDRRMEREKR